MQQGQGKERHLYPRVFNVGFGLWVFGVGCHSLLGWCVVTRGSCAKGVVRGAQPYLGARAEWCWPGDMMIDRVSPRWGVRPLRSFKVVHAPGGCGDRTRAGSRPRRIGLVGVSIASVPCRYQAAA